MEEVRKTLLTCPQVQGLELGEDTLLGVPSQRGAPAHLFPSVLDGPGYLKESSLS